MGSPSGKPDSNKATWAKQVSQTGEIQPWTEKVSSSSMAYPSSPLKPLSITGWSAANPSWCRAISE